jgi:hypothetical protein
MLSSSGPRRKSNWTVRGPTSHLGSRISRIQIQYWPNPPSCAGYQSNDSNVIGNEKPFALLATDCCVSSSSGLDSISVVPLAALPPRPGKLVRRQLFSPVYAVIGLRARAGSRSFGGGPEWLHRWGLSEVSGRRWGVT